MTEQERREFDDLKEAVQLLAHWSHFLGDRAKQRRLYELGYGPEPMQRSDGG